MPVFNLLLLVTKVGGMSDPSLHRGLVSPYDYKITVLIYLSTCIHVGSQLSDSQWWKVYPLNPFPLYTYNTFLSPLHI